MLAAIKNARVLIAQLWRKRTSFLLPGCMIEIK
jgi:hypothetical protein